MSCECGCGFEGEDDVVQFCVEEAAMITFDAMQSAALEDEQKRIEADTRSEKKPGEITDPVMQHAMAEAKRIHAEATGIHVR